MSLNGEINEIRDGWSSADWKGNVIKIIVFFISFLIAIFSLIYGADRVSLIFTGRNITEETLILSGSAIMFLSNFDVMLILSVIIWAVILAVVYVYIIDKLIEERTKAKNYHKKVLTQFEGLLKMANGETKYVLREDEVVWNNESFDHRIERVPSVKQSDEDMKDKLGEVYRELSKY